LHNGVSNPALERVGHISKGTWCHWHIQDCVLLIFIIIIKAFPNEQTEDNLNNFDIYCIQKEIENTMDESSKQENISKTTNIIE
jgi:hypothetical protein